MDAKPLEDFTMWAMLRDGGQRFDPDLLESMVRDWIQLATQKTAGQRKDKKSDLSWDNLERLKMGILGEAVALVLSGKLEIIKGGDMAIKRILGDYACNHGNDAKALWNEFADYMGFKIKE